MFLKNFTSFSSSSSSCAKRTLPTFTKQSPNFVDSQPQPSLHGAKSTHWVVSHFTLCLTEFQIQLFANGIFGYHICVGTRILLGFPNVPKKIFGRKLHVVLTCALLCMSRTSSACFKGTTTTGPATTSTTFESSTSTAVSTTSSEGPTSTTTMGPTSTSTIAETTTTEEPWAPGKQNVHLPK